MGDRQPPFVFNSLDHSAHLYVVVLRSEVVESFELLFEGGKYILDRLLLVELVESLLAGFVVLKLLLIYLDFLFGLLTSQLFPLFFLLLLLLFLLLLLLFLLLGILLLLLHLLVLLLLRHFKRLLSALLGLLILLLLLLSGVG